MPFPTGPVCRRYTPVGRSFFTASEGCSNPLGGGREVWFGFHQSVRPSLWKMMLNIDGKQSSVCRVGGIGGWVRRCTSAGLCHLRVRTGQWSPGGLASHLQVSQDPLMLLPLSTGGGECTPPAPTPISLSLVGASSESLMRGPGAVAFQPSGCGVAAPPGDSLLLCWLTQNGKPQRSLQRGSGSVSRTAFVICWVFFSEGDVRLCRPARPPRPAGARPPCHAPAFVSLFLPPVSATAFYKAQPVIEFVCEVLDFKSIEEQQKPLTDSQRVKFTKEIKGRYL